MELTFPLAFLITLLLELPICWLFLRRRAKLERIIPVALLANALTLPFVWFVFPHFIGDYWLSLALSEIFAFIAEAALYAYAFKLKAEYALALSFCANLLSFAAGLALALLA